MAHFTLSTSHLEKPTSRKMANLLTWNVYLATCMWHWMVVCCPYTTNSRLQLMPLEMWLEPQGDRVIKYKPSQESYGLGCEMMIMSCIDAVQS